MKALEGVRILDFTHVQSGPTCTQLLAWFGADVIKVERPGVGDATRGQLRDIPDVDSLYFTMLNHNKRSITLDSKNPKGKEVLRRLVETFADRLVEGDRADDGLHLIDDLLKLSGITQAPFSPQEMDLTQMARDLLDDLQRQDRERARDPGWNLKSRPIAGCPT